MEDQTSMQDSALLPKSLLGDVQVGDTITLKVMSIQEEEVEVAPAEMEEAEDEAEGGYEQADAALEAMGGSGGGY